jgi:hypothetical protein
LPSPPHKRMFVSWAATGETTSSSLSGHPRPVPSPRARDWSGGRLPATTGPAPAGASPGVRSCSNLRGCGLPTCGWTSPRACRRSRRWAGSRPRRKHSWPPTRSGPPGDHPRSPHQRAGGREDRDTTGPDQQSDDNQDDAQADLALDELDDADDHEDDGDDPQDGCHAAAFTRPTGAAYEWHRGTGAVQYARPFVKDRRPDGNLAR